MNTSLGIVNIHGLAEILICSKSTIQKTWREYPHFFIGLGKTAKSARFRADNVIKYSEKRDYREWAYQDQKTKKWVGDSRITGFSRQIKRGFKTKREAKKGRMPDANER